MARITVEDCLQYVDNRFDLVIKAAKRAHQLEMGEVDPLLDPELDKPTVIALREIAKGCDVVNAKTRRDVSERSAFTKVTGKDIELAQVINTHFDEESENG